MNSAAVGFQCPECVKEGARTTRSGALRFGGTPIANPHLTTIVLIALNAVVWLLVTAQGGATSKLLEKLSLYPLGQCAAGNGGYYPTVHSAAYCAQGSNGAAHWIDGVTTGAWWQVLTSAFTHQEALHIGFNMLALWFLGPILEVLVGRTRYLAVYLVSALAGSAAVMLFANPETATVGASGAIFGLMGALIVLGLKLGVDMRQLWLWLGLNLVFTFTAGNISWQGHLGGLAGGALAAAVLVYAPRQRRTATQATGLAALLMISVVLIATRATALS